MEKLPGDYIAGFVDGEGCFALKFRRDARKERKNQKVYFYWDVEFAINLKFDDRDILERIKNTLECGIVHDMNTRNLVRYSVQTTEDLHTKIVPFFEKYPLHAKKLHDFNLWKEAVKIFKNNQRVTVNRKPGAKGFYKVKWDKDDLKRLEEIHEAMKQYKGGNRGNWKWLIK